MMMMRKISELLMGRRLCFCMNKGKRQQLCAQGRYYDFIIYSNKSVRQETGMPFSDAKHVVFCPGPFIEGKRMKRFCFLNHCLNRGGDFECRRSVSAPKGEEVVLVRPRASIGEGNEDLRV